MDWFSNLIRRLMHNNSQNWDKWLKSLLFAGKVFLQASVGFFPFELLYGHKPCVVLDNIQENLEEGPP